MYDGNELTRIATTTHGQIRIYYVHTGDYNYYIYKYVYEKRAYR